MDDKRTLTNDEKSRMLDELAAKNVEVFWMSQDEIEEHQWIDEDSGELMPAGIYAWICHAGCLPDTEPLCFGSDKDAAVQEAWSWYIGDIE